jgi:hypothetical protein
MPSLYMNAAPPVAPIQKPGVDSRKIVTWLVVIAVSFTSVLTRIGHQQMMGTKYAVTSKENIDYSGSSTEQDAKALGEELKKLGYFENKRGADVLLYRDQNGTVISLVVNAKAWHNDKTMGVLKTFGNTLAADLKLQRLKLRLIDNKLNTKREVTIN